MMFQGAKHPSSNMVWNTQHLLFRIGAREVKMQFPHHPLLSDKPLHRESVLTILSMSFFHSMPSDVTRYHSLHTSSAAHNDLASRYDRMFSAMWSNPRAGGGGKEKKKIIFWGDTEFKTTPLASAKTASLSISSSPCRAGPTVQKSICG